MLCTNEPGQEGNYVDSYYIIFQFVRSVFRPPRARRAVRRRALRAPGARRALSGPWALRAHGRWALRAHGRAPRANLNPCRYAEDDFFAPYMRSKVCPILVAPQGMSQVQEKPWTVESLQCQLLKEMVERSEVLRRRDTLQLLRGRMERSKLHVKAICFVVGLAASRHDSTDDVNAI